MDEPTEPHLERRVFLRFDDCLLAAIKVHVDQQESRFDPCHVEREHARRMNVEGAPRFDERIPDPHRALSRNPYLVA